MSSTHCTPICTEKSLSLRKTKTDRIDARTIAAMLMSDVDLKSNVIKFARKTLNHL